MTLQLLCNTINHGNVNKAIDQFNLRYAVLDYFKDKKEGESMENTIQNIRRIVDEKINIKEDKDNKLKIESDKEYYFCIGQLLKYFYSLNKSSSKNYSFLNPILNAKTDKYIKEQLRRLFIKYDYAIIGYFKFNNLYYVVEAYEPFDSVNQDLLIAGFVPEFDI